VEPLINTPLYVVISKDDVLSAKDTLYLEDLLGKEMVRTKSSNMSATTQYLVQETKRKGHIISETADLLSFVARTKNTFTFIPEICIKNSLYLQTGALKCCFLADFNDVKGQCYLVYNKQYVAENDNILDMIRKTYQDN